MHPARLGAAAYGGLMAEIVFCPHCRKPVKLGFWRWWVRKLECSYCHRVNSIVRRWTLERG